MKKMIIAIALTLTSLASYASFSELSVNNILNCSESKMPKCEKMSENVKNLFEITENTDTEVFNSINEKSIDIFNDKQSQKDHTIESVNSANCTNVCIDLDVFMKDLRTK